MNKKILVPIVILLLLLPLITFLINIQDESDAVSLAEENQLTLKIDPKTPKTSGYQTYNELWIDNNSVSGNGTWDEIAAAFTWCTDVYLDGSLYLIEGITLNNPDNTGSPLLIGNSTGSFIIRNSTFLNSGAGNAGIRLKSVNNGKFYDNNISDCQYGIYLDGASSNNVFKNNTIANSLSDGIHFTSNSDNNDIINNTITTYNNYGLYSFYADGSIIENNTIDGGSAGLYFMNSENVVVRNNTITDGSSYGIYAQDTLNLELSGNTMQKCGILLHWFGNDVNRFRSTTIYVNNTVNGKPVYFYRDEIGLNSNNFTHAGNPGQIILVNCSYSDISNFNISDATVGITLGWSEYNMISNNTVNNGYYGIFLQYYSHNNTIFNNTVKDNLNFGIYLDFNCDENNITRNVVDNNYNPSYTYSAGIRLYYSDYCNINNNLLTSNKYGILLYFSTDNIVFNNTAKDNDDFGIALILRCTNNLILNNTAYDTPAGRAQPGGLYLLDEAERNNITNNDFSNNVNYGIYIYDEGFENNISYNTITGNTFNIYLYGNSHNNTIIYNNLSFSGINGVFVQLSYDNTFFKNEINDCTQDGIRLSFSDRNNFTQNNITNNGKFAFNDGIYLSRSDWNIFTDNLINNSEGWGIELYMSDNNTIKGNEIYFNKVGGIFLDGRAAGSNYNTIYLNYFRNNTVHAIDNSTGNKWDNGEIGNYWDNYTGSDPDDDGIGNNPHPIPGDDGNEDENPIWDDGQDVFPAPASGDDDDDDDDDDEAVIPGYDIYLLLGAVLITSIAIFRKRYKSNN